LYKCENKDAVEFKLFKQLSFPSAVESVEFVDEWMVFSVRNDNHLHYFHLESGERMKQNMNSFGDDYLSFNALDVKASPDGKYILVVTDTGLKKRF